MIHENTKPDNIESKIEIEKQNNKAKEELLRYLKLYLDSNPYITKGYESPEFELRFGGNKKSKDYKPYSKIDYDNVVSHLYSAGFVPENPDGIQSLRINPQYLDSATGKPKISRTRAEIIGTDMIQEYCKNNSIQHLLDMPSTHLNKLKFTQKLSVKENENYLPPINFSDINVKAAYQIEREYHARSRIIREMIDTWNDSKKIFRCMNRVRFKHKSSDFPIFVDISIVRSSKTYYKEPIPEYTIQSAGVFNNVESYEFEIEINNKKVGQYSKYSKNTDIMAALQKTIRIIMSALQGTNYPITNSEKNEVLHSYMKLLHGKEYEPRKVLARDFIGPSSTTLQLENIAAFDQINSSVPNIRNHYTVTDKADGERRLLYINGEGRIYMIDTNMNVIFTGSKTERKELYDSMLDGEHIKYGRVIEDPEYHDDSIHKNRPFINLYAAFDIYYLNGKSVREKAFYRHNEEDLDSNYRLSLLSAYIQELKPRSVIKENNRYWKEGKTKKGKTYWFDVKSGEITYIQPEINNACNFRIKCKHFYYGSDDSSIFQHCSTILSYESDNTFEYMTDGLIFTPANTGVGSNSVGVTAPLQKITWDLSFKWKPAYYNTIDFLVTIKKDKKGMDEIHNVFEEGIKTSGLQSLMQYKTLVLMCGFDEKKHSYMNPFNDIINEKYPAAENDNENKETYTAQPFQPSNPYDPNAYLCNIELKNNGNELFMITEETGEYFEENMIVEFRYDMTKEYGWRWIPLRVRYDKTSELRSGQRNYGNAYHVANSNWHSIHYSITKEMIASGENIPAQIINEDVYYNTNAEDNYTRALRNFHNLYVKRKLLQAVSEREHTLIDYSVGKAGDLPKWIHSKLSFVLGIDLSKDNIFNQLNGACVRYLNTRKTNPNIPYAIFLQGNSALNIRTQKAFGNEDENREKEIVKALFGTGSKDAGLLGKGVYRHYGIAHEGFNISSCQFSLHYFFENPTTLHGFLQNLAECTKLQGYFVGTCYDGRSVFELLSQTKKHDTFVISKTDKRGKKHVICEITKGYDETGFPDTDACIGYPINVCQDTINRTYREYLVNFNYLVSVLAHYGFVLVSKDNAEKMGLPDSTGLFSSLYTEMENEIKRDPSMKSNYKMASDMSNEEKTLSFINRYFIFQKVQQVNAAKISKLLLQKALDLDEEMNDDVALLDIEEIKSEVSKYNYVHPNVKKLNKPKIVLQEYVNIIEYSDDEHEETQPEEFAPKGKEDDEEISISSSSSEEDDTTSASTMNTMPELEDVTPPGVPKPNTKFDSIYGNVPEETLELWNKPNESVNENKPKKTHPVRYTDLTTGKKEELKINNEEITVKIKEQKEKPKPRAKNNTKKKEPTISKEEKLKAKEDEKQRAKEAKLKAKEDEKQRAKEAKLKAKEDEKQRAKEAKLKAKEDEKQRAKEAKLKAKEDEKQRAKEEKLKAKEEEKKKIKEDKEKMKQKMKQDKKDK
jgi:hypothetical protein